MISRLKKLFGSSESATPRPKPGQAGYTPGLILFADDEPEVRSIARLCLEQCGYKMIDAEDGVKALALFEQRRSEISLVVTDVLMPNMDGLVLSAKLHKLDPELPVLLLSGHVLEEDLWAPGNAKMRYLMKPYRLQDLQTAVSDLIGSPPAPPAPSAPSSPSPGVA
jgi:CheY-like chemotaxis protein